MHPGDYEPTPLEFTAVLAAISNGLDRTQRAVQLLAWQMCLSRCARPSPDSIMEDMPAQLHEHLLPQPFVDLLLRFRGLFGWSSWRRSTRTAPATRTT